MQTIKQFIKSRREGRELMRQLRQAWQEQNERIASMPFFTDEELRELYQRAKTLPPPSQPVPLPYLQGNGGQRRMVWRTIQDTLPPAAVAAVLLLFILPAPTVYAKQQSSCSVEVIDAVNHMLKEK